METCLARDIALILVGGHAIDTLKTAVEVAQIRKAKAQCYLGEWCALVQRGAGSVYPAT